MKIFARLPFVLAAALSAGCSSNPLLTTEYYEDHLLFRSGDEALGQNKFRITVAKTRFVGGRTGELWQMFKRNADEVVAREGCSGYAVLEYTEGNESAIVAGNRVARGVIECKDKQSPG